MRRFLPFLLSAVFAVWLPSPAARAGEEKIGVVFDGGHDTEGQDRGRPVALVAGGLGVPAQVFRDAFKKVHPAGPGSGGPTDAEARQNKAALMSALGKYGVTDERLNQVSNRYRYRRDQGELWPTGPAAAYALVRDGKVVSVVVTKGGYGYSSMPTATVPGHPETKLRAVVEYDKDLEKNGTITSLIITFNPPNPPWNPPMLKAPATR